MRSRNLKNEAALGSSWAVAPQKKIFSALIIFLLCCRVAGPLDVLTTRINSALENHIKWPGEVYTTFMLASKLEEVTKSKNKVPQATKYSH